MTSQQDTALEKIANLYEKNPIVRALVQLAMAPIPYGIGSAIDSTLTAQISRMREKRLRTFFDELAAGSLALTEELIQKEDFLHAYFSTLKAALNTRRSDKIKLFARLLCNAGREHRLDDPYEEYLSILDELSMRELSVLLLLKDFEDKHPYENNTKGELENDLQRAHRFWELFEAAAEAKYGVSRDHIPSVLTRLNRTGMYETITGGFLDYAGGKGKLTPRFNEFLNWLQVAANEIEPDEHLGTMAAG